MSHTPGQWIYQYEESDESRCGYLIRKKSTNRPVAFVASANQDTQREQLACLIATAPELLTALRIALDNLSADISAPAMYAIEDAIAKAEGKK